MNENRNMAFWVLKTGWPDDAYGYAFLGRAVNLVGKHLFDDSWTGGEPCAPEPYDFWKEFNGVPLSTHPRGRDGMSNADKVAAHRLLALHRPEFNRSPMIEYGHFGPIIPDFSHDEWLAAVELAKEENKARNEAHHRRDGAFNLLKEAMRDGQIAFALLPLKGGRFSENCDKSWWNTTDVASRFYMCQMNPLDPFGIGVAGDQYMHIFVGADALASLLAPPTEPDEVAAVPMRPKSNEGYAAALALLNDWSPPKRTRREFEALCKEHGISSLNARDAYKSLGVSRGRKRARPE
jgi:hypothetical protein